MSTAAKCAGLVDLAVMSSQQVRLVKARLLRATQPEAVQEILEYSGVQESEFAAVLLAATDGDVVKCKEQIDLFWKDKHYMGPLIDDEGDHPIAMAVRFAGQRAKLEDTL